MESFAKLRRRHLVKGESISAIARDLNLSPNTVKKYLKADVGPAYRRQQQPCPKLENQVGNVREWCFTPRPAFADLATLNVWLEARCRELAGRAHPVEKERSIAQMFAEEQPRLRVITAPFDGYFEQPCRVSSTCLVAYDRNRYSVPEGKRW